MQHPLQPVENRQTLLGLGIAWTRVGYGTLALAVIALVLWHTVNPAQPLQAGKIVDGLRIAPEGYKLIGNKDGGWYLRASSLGFMSIFFLAFSGLAGFVWTLVDLVDRRMRFVWILPVVICVFLQALHAFPLALYLFYGRETSPPDEGVK